MLLLLCVHLLTVHLILPSLDAEDEQDDNQQRQIQKQKLAGTGLTSDKEDEFQEARSGYESDDNQAEERQRPAEALTGLLCIHDGFSVKSNAA